MEFSIEDLFSKYDQIRMKNSLMENFIFVCSVSKNFTA